MHQYRGRVKVHEVCDHPLDIVGVALLWQLVVHDFDPLYFDCFKRLIEYVKW